VTIDPRTPVLVGGGQITERTGGVEPVDLLAAAARRAADDAASPDLLAAVDSVRLVRMLSWKYRDPGRLLAERIGAAPKHTGYTGNGGNSPQALVNGAAADIAAGRADVVLVGGAESWRTRMRLRAQGERPAWTVQDESVPKAEVLVPEVPMATDAETRIGLDRPAYVYPLFEQSLRISLGRTVGDHLAAVGDLWARFSKVAATNPHAWTQREHTAAEIVTPNPDNRWISWPYPKLLNSNNMVEQAAAVLVCSAAAATRLGVPRERWVFPQSGAEAHDTFAVAERDTLHGSPAIRLAGAEALRVAGIGVDDLAFVDVYSCFPSAVQIAARELRLPADDPGRPLTVTGGLTFAGGPWNNYSTHAIATMIARLRESPGSYGLVTANGGYLTKHAIGVYRSEPPRDGFRPRDVQAEVDRLPTTPSLPSYDGQARVESWTVVHDRDGDPERAFLAVRTPSGERTLTTSTEPDELQRLVTEDVAGTDVVVTPDGQSTFATI